MYEVNLLNSFLKKIIKRILSKFNLVITKEGLSSGHMKATELYLAEVQDVVIFDVGAFNGETVIGYSKTFPKAKIFAFEPFPDSFIELKRNTSGVDNLRCENFGLTDSEGPQSFNVNQAAPTNSLLPVSENAQENWSGNRSPASNGTVECQFTTLDDYVNRSGIDRIDLLKIDVQGAEFKVLNGGLASLKSGVIKLIYMEMILVETYDDQKPISYYMEFFERHNYALIGFYNQSYNDNNILTQVDMLLSAV
jgi:FkbM family methyltransferase